MLSNTLFSLLFNIIVSIIIILIIHYLWNYLKDTYSTKKSRDLVNIQIDKYKKILDNIQNNQINNKMKDSKKPIFETEQEKQSMNDDLMNFLNEQTK